MPETTWCDRPGRRAAAGVPDQVEFATKPALARQMIAAALDAGVPVGWVTGDEVYGASPPRPDDPPPGGVYAVAHGHRTIFGCPHKSSMINALAVLMLVPRPTPKPGGVEVLGFADPEPGECQTYPRRCDILPTPRGQRIRQPIPTVGP
uniref:transposase n=1 Tax=Micromonospora purpureochromogenes TaxID=47872 RepID=UPI00358DBC22